MTRFIDATLYRFPRLKLNKMSLMINEIKRGDLIRRFETKRDGTQEELSRYIVLDKVERNTFKVRVISSYVNAHHKPGDIRYIKDYIIKYTDFWEIVVKGGLS